MIRKAPGIAAIAITLLSLGVNWTFTRQGSAPAAPAALAGPVQGRGAAAPTPPAPQRLFNLTLQNETRQPLTQNTIMTPNVDLQLYGDGENIIVAVGTGANLPRTFFGLCKGPCGFTLRDRNSYFDLRGRANIQFTTIVSGFHRVRPIIKLLDGTLLIGDQAEGSVADYHQYIKDQLDSLLPTNSGKPARSFWVRQRSAN